MSTTPVPSITGWSSTAGSRSLPIAGAMGWAPSSSCVSSSTATIMCRRRPNCTRRSSSTAAPVSRPAPATAPPRISPRPSNDAEEWKTLGRAVAVQCLEALAASPDIKFGAVWRGTSATGRAYYEERGAVYQELIEGWNAEHRATDTYAFVSMDGNSDDPTYFNAHRSLPLDTRHLIEDPMMHDSRRSQ